MNRVPLSLILPIIFTITIGCKTVEKTNNRNPVQAAKTSEDRSLEQLPGNSIEPTPKKADPQCVDADTTTCEVEYLITKYTNELVREPAGRSPLVHNPRISYASRKWSEAMGQGKGGGVFSWFSGGLSHKGFPRQRKLSYQEKFNESVSMKRENVAYGPRGQDADQVARKFVNMWKNSPGHYRNMVSNTNQLGNGVYFDGSKWWATQIFGN